MSVERAAKGLIKKGQVNDGLLNIIEMAFRADEPCFGCATHAAGQVPLRIRLIGCDGRVLNEIVQG